MNKSMKAPDHPWTVAFREECARTRMKEREVSEQSRLSPSAVRALLSGATVPIGVEFAGVLRAIYHALPRMKHRASLLIENAQPSLPLRATLAEVARVTVPSIESATRMEPTADPPRESGPSIVVGQFLDATSLGTDEVITALDTFAIAAIEGSFTIRARGSTAFAEACLQKSKGNVRRDDPGAIARYARDMSAGEWRYTAVPWIFNIDGVFVDGHHRAGALKKSGSTIDLALAFGVPQQAVQNIDRGRVRTIGNVLGDNRGAAIARAVGDIVRGDDWRPSDAEVRDAYDWVRPAVEALPWGTAYRAHVFAVLAIGWFGLPEITRKFAFELIAPEANEVSPTIRVLRARLREMKGRMASNESMQLTAAALRAYAEGTAVRRLMVWDQDAFQYAGLRQWLLSNLSKRPFPDHLRKTTTDTGDTA
jgi:hypothetical protein